MSSSVPCVAYEAVMRERELVELGAATLVVPGHPRSFSLARARIGSRVGASCGISSSISRHLLAGSHELRRLSDIASRVRTPPTASRARHRQRPSSGPRRLTEQRRRSARPVPRRRRSRPRVTAIVRRRCRSSASARRPSAAHRRCRRGRRRRRRGHRRRPRRSRPRRRSAPLPRETMGRVAQADQPGDSHSITGHMTASL